MQDDSRDLKKLLMHSFEMVEDIKLSELKDIGSDVTGLISFAHKTLKIIKQKKFKMFLSGFSGNKDVQPEMIEKLNKYLLNETNIEYLSNTFNKVLQSNSMRACKVMGVMFNDIVNSESEIKMEHLISIKALGELFDEDIENFISLNKLRAESKSGNIYLSNVKEYVESKFLNYENMILSLEKMTSLQLFLTDYHAYIDADIDGEMNSIDFNATNIEESYSISKSGEYLYNQILKTNRLNPI